MPGVALVSSLYAVEEARRNLSVHRSQSLSDLDDLVSRMEIVSGLLSEVLLSDEVDLPEKDAPILAAAVQSKCTHLLTGDKQHFDALYGKSVEGVIVLLPAEYIRRREFSHG